jgi:hypothetical protein
MYWYFLKYLAVKEKNVCNNEKIDDYIIIPDTNNKNAINDTEAKDVINETVINQQETKDEDEKKADQILENNYVIITKPIKELMIKKIICGIIYMIWKNKMSLINFIGKTILKYINFKLYCVVIVIGIIIFIIQLRTIILHF